MLYVKSKTEHDDYSNFDFRGFFERISADCVFETTIKLHRRTTLVFYFGKDVDGSFRSIFCGGKLKEHNRKDMKIHTQNILESLEFAMVSRFLR